MPDYNPNYPYDDRSRRSLPAPPPVVPATAVEVRQTPANVTILKGHQRVGRQDRDRYLAWITDLYSREFMTEAEFEARKSALTDPAVSAVEVDLQQLMADLPPFPLTAEEEAGLEAAKRKDKKAKKKAKEARANPWNQANVRVVTYVMVMVASLIVAIVPEVIVANSPLRQFFGLGQAVAVICTIAGVACFVAMLIWTCYWMSEMADWDNNLASKNKGTRQR